jgi:hypothetical protein
VIFSYCTYINCLKYAKGNEDKAPKSMASRTRSCRVLRTVHVRSILHQLFLLLENAAANCNFWGNFMLPLHYCYVLSIFTCSSLSQAQKCLVQFPDGCTSRDRSRACEGLTRLQWGEWRIAIPLPLMDPRYTKFLPSLEGHLSPVAGVINDVLALGGSSYKSS